MIGRVDVLLAKIAVSDMTTAAFAVTVGLGFIEAAWFWRLLPFALLNVLARVAAGVHYPTDIIAGAALGTLTASVIVLNAHRFDAAACILGRISDRVLPFLPHPPTTLVRSDTKNPHP